MGEGCPAGRVLGGPYRINLTEDAGSLDAEEEEGDISESTHVDSGYGL